MFQAILLSSLQLARALKSKSKAVCVTLQGCWSGDICLHPYSMSSFEALMPLHILNMTSNGTYTHSICVRASLPPAIIQKHWVKERRQRKRVLPCEWNSFLSWGQVHNDPAKMDREIVLWSDPRTQIGGGQSGRVCVCVCVSCTTTDLTAPLVWLDGWVLRGHVGPRARIREKKNPGTMRQWEFGRGVGWVGMHASHITHTQFESTGCCFNKYLWMRPMLTTS